MLEGLEQGEDSFLDDDEDDSSFSSTGNLYAHYKFPVEEPTSVRFKGKKSVFVNSVIALKDVLKRGEGSNINNVSFKVLDVRELQHGIEYDIQCSKNNEKGVSVLKIYGPNPKKGCTIMICKSREHKNKFVSMLSNDVIKYLLDTFESTDGWKTVLKFSTFKKPSCLTCKKSFCSEKNLNTHIKKFHTNNTIFKCDVCDITYETENSLKEHNEKNHTNNKIIQCEICTITFENENILKTHTIKDHPKDKVIKCESCDYTVNDEKYMAEHKQQIHKKIENETKEDDNEMEVDIKTEDSDSKIKILEETIKTMMKEHDSKVSKLTKEFEDKEKLYETNKKRMEKEDSRKSNEIRKLKEENATILEKLGQLQWNKDKMDAELKAREKTENIKNNMKLFNEIIRKQENGMANKKIDNEMPMEVFESDDIIELQILQQNKQRGFSRTTPQKGSEIRRRIENCENKIIHCPQCDFITPSEHFFNEHMTLIHTGPNCPFCFLAFDGYPALRKHCTENHEESSNKSGNMKSKKPCRFFRNGEGKCSPRNGEECQFDHSIIPFSQRQECFHKQSCKFKPYCIFFHPEGQNVESWQKSTNRVSKICHYSQQGINCTRSECRYYHPEIKNYQGFQWEQVKKPPIMTNPTSLERVPVIVKNINVLKKLSLSMRSMDQD